MRILFVEHQQKLAHISLRSLRVEGFAVDAASTAEDGYQGATTDDYDLIILDLQLPDRSGADLLRRLRQRQRKVPVLALTTREELEARGETVEGADDYLTKPYSLPELTARVRALLHRGSTVGEATLKLADLEIDRLARQVTRAGKRIELSPKEYALLDYLLLNPGRVLSRSMIIDRLWGQSFEGFANSVDVYVRQLRCKIDKEFEPRLIRTVRGLGYAIDLLA